MLKINTTCDVSPFRLHKIVTQIYYAYSQHKHTKNAEPQNI